MFKVTLAFALLPIVAGCTASHVDSSTTQNSADTAASSTDASVPLANFIKVRDGLYRGGHPDAAGFDYLVSLNVHRVVDLEVPDFIEATPGQILQELSDAQDRNITEFAYPMSAFEPAIRDAFDQKMDALQALLATGTADDPIYVHCKHGQDRTGLVIGLERVTTENWMPQDAHDEMVRIGFHVDFIGLEYYYEWKTNWSPPSD